MTATGGEPGKARDPRAGRSIAAAGPIHIAVAVDIPWHGAADDTQGQEAIEAKANKELHDKCLPRSRTRSAEALGPNSYLMMA